MSDIRIISSKEHGNKRWFKPSNFSFAAKDRVAALGFSEISKAMMSLPIGFIKTADQYVPVVVQGLTHGQNLLVGQDGKWLADYVPVVYRTYPFKLAKNAAQQFVMCIDHDSGLLSDGAAGYQILEDEKKLAPEANANATQLMQFEADRPRTVLACKTLSDHGLIDPWVLQLQQQNDEIQSIDGLFRINESALMKLSAEALAEIRNIGGLVLCYAQLFSMQHMQHLGAVAQRSNWAARAAGQASKVVPLNIVDDNGTISFANLV